MSQTRFLRTVIALTWRERLRLVYRGVIAVSATVYPDRVADVQAAPFPGSQVEAEHWIATGSRFTRPDSGLSPELEAAIRRGVRAKQRGE